MAHVEEVREDDFREEFPDEADHMPAYYQGLAADFWFRLLDARRLVADDTVATIEELNKLRNTRYHDRRVSIYGGMTELPLIVRCSTEVSWFGAAESLTDGRLWAERDAEMRGEVERLGRELRNNLLGREVWSELAPASRTFRASAEAVFRSHRDDPAFDFTGPAMSYAKAVATELIALVFPGLRRVLERQPPAEGEVHDDGRLLDVPHSLA